MFLVGLAAVFCFLFLMCYVLFGVLLVDFVFLNILVLSVRFPRLQIVFKSL